MNVKEYISSGIIESYVLGLVTDTERQEFEQLCAQYPEILNARNVFELKLEEQLISDAKEAPRDVKQLIQARLSAINSDTGEQDAEHVDAVVHRVGIWKWLAAASIILLVGAVYWNYRLNNKYKELQTANKNLQEQIKQSADQLALLKEDTEMLHKPGIKMAALRGTSQAPEAYATVYWDTANASKDVYLMVNNLPQPASGSQYQLWALLNGKPIDLGVLDMTLIRKRLLVKMQNLQNAQAFAITLEPRGGSASPTMDKMYVMGTL